MGVSPFIYGPVTVLGVLALLSVLGMGSTQIHDAGLANATFGNIDFSGSGAFNEAYFYNYYGVPICFKGNISAVDPADTTGRITGVDGVSGVAFWNNASGTFPIYMDAYHEHPALIQDTGLYLGGRNGGFSATIGTALGIIAIISGLIAVGVIASVRIFGFGLSDVGINTLMKGGAYIIIWAIFSGLAMNLIVAGGDFYTPIIWLALTGAYAFGVLGDLGTPSQG